MKSKLSLKSLLDFVRGLSSRLLRCKLSKEEKPTIEVKHWRDNNGEIVIQHVIQIRVSSYDGFEELSEDKTI